jgi:hypothetical protein
MGATNEVPVVEKTKPKTKTTSKATTAAGRKS